MEGLSTGEGLSALGGTKDCDVFMVFQYYYKIMTEFQANFAGDSIRKNTLPNMLVAG